MNVQNINENKKYKEKRLKLVFQIGGFLGLFSLVIFHPNYYIKTIAIIIILVIIYLIDPITKLMLLYKRMISIKYDILSVFYVNRFLTLSSAFGKIMNDEVIQEIFKNAEKDYKNEEGMRYDRFLNGSEYDKWKGIKKWKWVRKFNHGNLLENIFKFEEYVIRKNTACINGIVSKDDNNISEHIKHKYNIYFRISYLHFIDTYMILLFEINEKFKHSYHFQTYSNSIQYKDLQIEEYRLFDDKMKILESKILILNYEKRIDVLTNLIKGLTNIASELNKFNISDRHSTLKIMKNKIEHNIIFIKNDIELMEKISQILKYSTMNYEDLKRLDKFKGYNYEDIKKEIDNFWLEVKKDLEQELINTYNKRDGLIS